MNWKIRLDLSGRVSFHWKTLIDDETDVIWRIKTSNFPVWLSPGKTTETNNLSAIFLSRSCDKSFLFILNFLTQALKEKMKILFRFSRELLNYFIIIKPSFHWRSSRRFCWESFRLFHFRRCFCPCVVAMRRGKCVEESTYDAHFSRVTMHTLHHKTSRCSPGKQIRLKIDAVFRVFDQINHGLSFSWTWKTPKSSHVKINWKTPKTTTTRSDFL